MVPLFWWGTRLPTTSATAPTLWLKEGRTTFQRIDISKSLRMVLLRNRLMVLSQSTVLRYYFRHLTWFILWRNVFPSALDANLPTVLCTYVMATRDSGAMNEGWMIASTYDQASSFVSFLVSFDLWRIGLVLLILRKRRHARCADEKEGSSMTWKMQVGVSSVSDSVVSDEIHLLRRVGYRATCVDQLCLSSFGGNLNVLWKIQ